jgi:hypothetical protein
MSNKRQINDFDDFLHFVHQSHLSVVFGHLYFLHFVHQSHLSVVYVYKRQINDFGAQNVGKIEMVKSKDK